MNCSFCGLETGSPTSHETQEACIEALRSQVSQLRNVLQHTRHPGDGLKAVDAPVHENTAMAYAQRPDSSSR